MWVALKDAIYLVLQQQLPVFQSLRSLCLEMQVITICFKYIKLLRDDFIEAVYIP